MPRWFSFTVILLLTVARFTTAQHLPIRSYSPAIDCPVVSFNNILRDSRGYLWISTRNGLARFDGYRFITYGTEQGLSYPTVNFVLETHTHKYLRELGWLIAGFSFAHTKLERRHRKAEFC
jgi:ligand-binding sensor domain-containing protein